MVISTMPDEGKSFVTMQLWRQMAETGIDSVLIDADMRKSVMVDKYDVKKEDGGKILGCSYYLANDIPLEQAVLKTQYEHGDILPNNDNVVNPSILLENHKFADMLDELAGKYRYVFVDAPPLNLVSDGERIGSLCDGAVLVVRGNSTPKSIVKTLHCSLSVQAVRCLAWCSTVSRVQTVATTINSMAVNTTAMDMVRATVTAMGITERISSSG